MEVTLVNRPYVSFVVFAQLNEFFYRLLERQDRPGILRDVVSVDGIPFCEIIVVPAGLLLRECIFRSGDDLTTCHPINFEDTPTLRDFSANLC